MKDQIYSLKATAEKPRDSIDYSEEWTQSFADYGLEI
jgi:hypothetical protein